MSGHSAYSNIKHKKEANDAAKGKLFTIIGREIAVAVKEGGPDPDNNYKLAAVIAKARANSMPKETIERGIKKASGDTGAVAFQQNTYEGYGPGGVAIIVETLTDNVNRTASEVRAAFSRGNGSMGAKGSVAFQFDERGQIIIAKEQYSGTADDLMMIVLDAGAEDLQEEEDSFVVITNPNDFIAVTKALEDQNIPMAVSEIKMIPKTYVSVTDEADVKGLKIILSRLEECMDVKTIYHNWENVEE